MRVARWHGPADEETMIGIKPGQSPGNKGGIYQEQGPKGGKKENFATIPDNHKAPPHFEAWQHLCPDEDYARQ